MKNTATGGDKACVTLSRATQTSATIQYTHELTFLIATQTAIRSIDKTAFHYSIKKKKIYSKKNVFTDFRTVMALSRKLVLGLGRRV